MADPREALPLSVPVFQILLSLSDRVLHGYGLIQDIRERTNGEVDLTASTLYGALKRMLADGIVDEVPAPPDRIDDDPRRRYYDLTPFGHEVVGAEVARLRRALDEAAAKGIPEAGGRPATP